MMIIGGIGVVYYLFISKSKITVLHLAIEKWNDLDVLKLINEEGTANIEARDMDGNTPLHIVSRCNRHMIAKMLIDEGVTVNVKNKMGNTPLHWAAVHDACETAEVLILGGADIDIENKQGATPLNVAEAKGHLNLSQILRQVQTDEMDRSLGSDERLGVERRNASDGEKTIIRWVRYNRFVHTTVFLFSVWKLITETERWWLWMLVILISYLCHKFTGSMQLFIYRKYKTPISCYALSACAYMYFFW